MKNLKLSLSLMAPLAMSIMSHVGRRTVLPYL